MSDKTGKIGKTRHYSDERIDVSYDATRCIHAAECVHRLPAVFDTARRPWILPSGGDVDEIAAVVGTCPTGALHATRLDGGPAEEIPIENTIVPVRNGPLHLRGQLQLRAPEIALTVDDVRIALCRCGQSRNKPFCDNSHREAGFHDPGKIAGASAGSDATATDAAPANDTAGAPASDTATRTRQAPDAPTPLTVTASPNGPLAIQGAFTLRTRDGGTRQYAVQATLCRCGASNRKPFCDGSHRRIGFISAPQSEA